MLYASVQGMGMGTFPGDAEANRHRAGNGVVVGDQKGATTKWNCVSTRRGLDSLLWSGGEEMQARFRRKRFGAVYVRIK